MSMGSTRPPQSSIAVLRDSIVETREFPVEHNLRGPIERSWRRCLINGVDPGRPTASPPALLSNPDSLVVKASRDIVKSRADLLCNSPVGLMVADRHALVMSRTCGDERLTGLLLESGSEVGNRLDEAVFGTNGVGTALEEQSLVQITGPEHFADAFREFSCVGVPIRHPMSRRIIGVVNLTCQVDFADALMVPFAQETARAIEEQLYLASSRSERLLLQHFLTRQRSTERPFVALNEQFMITSPAASRLLANVDHSHLWELANSTEKSSTGGVETLLTPTGEELQIRFSMAEADDTGIIVELLPMPDLSTAHSVFAAVRPVERPLPGLVGRSSAWRQVEDSARKAQGMALPLLVCGARGTGKRAVINAMFAEQSAAGLLYCFDGRMQAVQGVSSWVQQVGEALAVPRSVVVLSHIPAIDAHSADAISALLDSAGPAVARIVGIYSDEQEVPRALVGLLERLAVAKLQLPLLRDRLEDLPDLLNTLSERHAPAGSQMRWRDDAVQLLARLLWPGNVRELENVIRLVSATHHGRTVRAEDLPADVRQHAYRRQLTLLERLEFEAIVAANERVRGNKTEAAAILGISRATLYRKMRTYGIPISAAI